MNPQLLIVLGLLVAAVGMFAMNRPRMDAVALIMLTVLPFTGVITMGEALAGFSDPNIVLIAALFVIGEGLVRTGAAQQLGDWLIKTAGTSGAVVVVLLMVAVGALGAVMSSTGAVAIFIPVAMRVAANTGIVPSQLMMPMSVAALISGMLTLVGTAPNLVVNSALMRHGAEGFHFFSFTPFGLPILALGIGYMLFARRLLPSRTEGGDRRTHRPTLRDWAQAYGLTAQRWKVLEGSPLVGKALAETELGTSTGVSVLSIERMERGRMRVTQPSATTELRVGDMLFFPLRENDARANDLAGRFGLESVPLDDGYVSDRVQELGLAELMIAADSTLVGKTLQESDFRGRFGLTALGLRHGADRHSGAYEEEPLRVGDTLLVVGRWDSIDRLKAETHELLILQLPAEAAQVLPVQGRMLQAVACLLLMVVLMVTGVVPNVQAAFIACLLMGALRCIDLDSAYGSIHWKSLVLIVGMLPFSLALERTGGVELAAGALFQLTGSLGPLATLGAVFAITAGLGLFISNTATAVLMAPVALALATDLGASPYPFAMIVALGASSAFMTPISSPVNTLVVGPGGYGFMDFVKVGVPLTILVMIVSVLMVSWLMPLYPLK